MADTLQNEGRYYGMLGIRNETASLQLLASDTTVIDTVTISTPSTEFSVSTSTGTLSNDNAITFTIAAGDVGKTATQVAFVGGSAELMRVDLDSSVSLTTQGDATIAAGDLTARL
jgi:hypothetical protein